MSNPPPFPQQPHRPGQYANHDNPYYTGSALDPLRPARFASVTLYVLGGLILLMSTCCLSTVALWDTITSNPQFTQSLSANGADFNQIRNLFAVVTLFLGVLGIAYIALGYFVRRGGMGSVVTALVMASLVALFLVLLVITAIVRAKQTPEGIVGVVFWLIPLTLHLLLGYWLIQTLRNADQIGALRYWEQQGGYGAAGYGAAGYGAGGYGAADHGSGGYTPGGYGPVGYEQGGYGSGAQGAPPYPPGYGPPPYNPPVNDPHAPPPPTPSSPAQPPAGQDDKPDWGDRGVYDPPDNRKH